QELKRGRQLFDGITNALWKNFGVSLAMIPFVEQAHSVVRPGEQPKHSAGVKLGVFGEENGSSTFREMRSKILN
ncbi:MAG TPA: hypothetical protein VK493_10660, partial [Bryobacteraceae bacterium]|nr:hypothetical protein [Bryobacteraceae bacterium]